MHGFLSHARSYKCLDFRIIRADVTHTNHITNSAQRNNLTISRSRLRLGNIESMKLLPHPPDALPLARSRNSSSLATSRALAHHRCSPDDTMENAWPVFSMRFDPPQQYLASLGILWSSTDGNCHQGT